MTEKSKRIRITVPILRDSKGNHTCCSHWLYSRCPFYLSRQEQSQNMCSLNPGVELKRRDCCTYGRGMGSLIPHTNCKLTNYDKNENEN